MARVLIYVVRENLDFDYKLFFETLKDKGGEELESIVRQRFEEEIVEPAKARVCRELEPVVNRLSLAIARISPLVTTLVALRDSLVGMLEDLNNFQINVFGNIIRIPRAIIRPVETLVLRVDNAVTQAENLINTGVDALSEFVNICGG